MTAIITDKLKKLMLQDLVNDVADSASNYYIGIGRSEDWDSSDTAPTTQNSLKEERNLRINLQSIKTAEDVSFVVPRYDWRSGTIYSEWNDAQQGYPTNAYYVVNNNNAVYICLKQGTDLSGNAVTSTVEPTGSSTSSFKTADGYIWKFLYTISALNTSKYLSANFMPVQKILATDSDSPATDVEQKTIQDAAVVGQIANIQLTSGGTGYSTAPTVTISGDGDSAEAFAIISGGAVVDVRMDSDGAGNVKHGSGYTKATVSFSSGSAAATATLPPIGGFGADPREDLKSTSIMFNTKPAGAESGKFIVGNDFRQVALFKNPKVPATDSDFTQSAGLSLKSLTLTLPVATAFTAGNTLLGATSSAQAIIDSFDSDTIYYHQNETTGFTAFTGGEAVTETDGSGSGTLDSAGTFGDGDVNLYNYTKGDLLFIENRAAIDRSADQTEDLKIIIQL